MNKNDKIRQRLLNHSVRIRKNEITVGSGFLYIPPKEQYKGYAYVLTAAHIFKENDCPLEIQVFSDGKMRTDYDFLVEPEQIVIHSSYDKCLDEQVFQEQDAALVRIPYKEWMEQYETIPFGNPYEGLGVCGIIYSSATCDEDIRYDYSMICETEVRDLFEDSMRMRMQIKGNFDLNHASRNMEVEGMSGAILASDDEVSFLVGAFVSVPRMNGALGIANLIKMNSYVELLETEGIHVELLPMEPKMEPDEKDSIQIFGRMSVMMDPHFLFREKEIQKIDLQLNARGIVVLTGMGGIGKTSIARQYACFNRRKYTNVFQISCTDSVYKGLAQEVVIDGLPRRRLEKDEEYGARILSWLRRNEKKDSLYLFDNISVNDDAFSQVLSMVSDKILISRCPSENWNIETIEIKALETLEEQKSLFEQYYERQLTQEELEDFSAIAAIVNGHTMALIMTAIQIRESAISLKQARKILEDQGIYTESSVLFPYSGSPEEQNMYGHLRNLWKLNEWSKEEQKMMSLLCLIPSIGIGKEELRSILGEEGCNILNRLRRKGWIQEFFYGAERWISLHNVISEIVYREVYLQIDCDFSEFISYILCHVWDMRNLVYIKQYRYMSYGEYLVKRLKNSTAKLDAMLILVQQYEFLREIQKGLELLDYFKTILEEMGLKNSIYHAHYHNNLALLYQRADDLGNALEHFAQAKKIYKGCGEEALGNYALLLHNEARIQYSLGYRELALELEEEAEPLLKTHNSRYWGYIYDVRGDYCSYKARKTYENRNSYPTPLAVQKVINRWLKKWNECQETACYLKRTYRAPMHEIIISIQGRALSRAYCGIKEDAQKDIEMVYEYKKQRLDARSEDMAYLYDQMCIVYEKTGEYRKAVEYGKLAVDIYTERLGINAEEVEKAKHNLKMAQAHL